MYFSLLGFMYTLYMQADGAGSAGLRNIPTSKCTFVCTVHKNKTLLDNSHSHFYFFKAGNQFNLKIFNFVNNISFRIVTSWHENYQLMRYYLILIWHHRSDLILNYKISKSIFSCPGLSFSQQLIQDYIMK